MILRAALQACATGVGFTIGAILFAHLMGGEPVNWSIVIGATFGAFSAVLSQ